MRASHISHHSLDSRREARSSPIFKNESKNLPRALGSARLRRRLRARQKRLLLARRRLRLRGSGMYGRLLTLSMFVALSAVEAPVAAADKETCFKEEGNTAVAACTRLIESEDFVVNGLAVIYYNRGATLYDMGQYDRAIQDYDAAIKLNPNFGQAVFNRGNAYDEKGQYDRAIQDYNLAIELSPDYAKVFNNRGYVYDEKREYDRAIRDYDRALELNPSYAEALNNRGIAYGKMGEYIHAIRDYDRAIELEPKYAEAFNNRGGVYYQIRDYDRAIQDYDEAIKLKRNFAMAFYNRGMAKLKRGDTAAGDADIAIAKVINPGISGLPLRP
jgi:tetratricopeptide (TPR) repeat protein